MFKKLKIILLNKLIYPALHLAFKCLLPYAPDEQKLISERLNNKDVFFINLGANDGVTTDKLAKLIKDNRNWKGLFVEPVDYLFEKLKNNYNNEQRFYFENSAIHTRPRRAIFC